MAKIQVFFVETLQTELDLNPAKEYLVGSGWDCDVRLDYAGVAERHCLLKSKQWRWIVENLSPTLLRINGEAAQTRELHHRDRIQVGEHVLVFDDALTKLTQDIGWTLESMEAPDEAAVAAPEESDLRAMQRAAVRNRRTVLVLEGWPRRAVYLDKDMILIGAAPHCDLRISGSFVKPEHAVVMAEHLGYRLISKGGLRPVSVNGERIEDVMLQSGDVISIANNRITVQTL